MSTDEKPKVRVTYEQAMEAVTLVLGLAECKGHMLILGTGAAQQINDLARRILTNDGGENADTIKPDGEVRPVSVRVHDPDY